MTFRVEDAGGRVGVVFDRRLSQAERRLHASLKSLATLRPLRQPVVNQINVAGRPMHVVNGAEQQREPARLRAGAGGGKGWRARARRRCAAAHPSS
jgi:hypothetical protein